MAQIANLLFYVLDILRVAILSLTISNLSLGHVGVVWTSLIVPVARHSIIGGRSFQ